MKLPELQKKLIAAARSNPPSDRVPYAFEKRVIALIESRSIADHWLLWSRSLWRAALGCLAVVALLGALSAFVPQTGNEDLSQEFENTMLASADQEADSAW